MVLVPTFTTIRLASLSAERSKVIQLNPLVKILVFFEFKYHIADTYGLTFLNTFFF